MLRSPAEMGINFSGVEMRKNLTFSIPFRAARSQQTHLALMKIKILPSNHMIAQIKRIYIHRKTKIEIQAFLLLMKTNDM